MKEKTTRISEPCLCGGRKAAGNLVCTLCFESAPDYIVKHLVRGRIASRRARYHAPDPQIVEDLLKHARSRARANERVWRSKKLKEKAMAYTPEEKNAAMIIEQLSPIISASRGGMSRALFENLTRKLTELLKE